MKIFLDTADISKIKHYKETGLIDGITTNPTHLSKIDKDPKKTILEICKLLPHGCISVEVTKHDAKDVYKQAHEIAKLSKNIWVKIPCHADYYPVIKKLVEEKIKLNITLVFSLLQSLMMCKLNVDLISPFIGRWDDIDVDGISYIPEIRTMIELYDYKTEILAASIRTVYHFHQVINAGAHIVTLPVDVFEKSLHHPLTNEGIAKFNKDWQKLGIKQFP